MFFDNKVIKRKMKAISEYFSPDEFPLMVCSVSVNDIEEEVVFTDERILFIFTSWDDKISVRDVLLRDIQQIRCGLVDIELLLSGETIKISFYNKKNMSNFISFYNRLKDGSYNKPQKDVVQTKDLTEEQAYRLNLLQGLKDKGILSEEEYAQEERRVLKTSHRINKKKSATELNLPVETKTLISTEDRSITSSTPTMPSKPEEKKSGCASGCFSLILWGIIILVFINYFMK